MPHSTHSSQPHTRSIRTDNTMVVERPLSHPLECAVDTLKAHMREKPEVAALWCFGVGFVLGWKLKPW